MMHETDFGHGHPRHPRTRDTVNLRVAIFVLSEMGRDVSRQIELHIHRTTHNYSIGRA